MLIVMKQDATEAQVRAVVEVIEAMGYEARPMPGRQRTTVGLVGNDGRVDDSRLDGLGGGVGVGRRSGCPHTAAADHRGWRGGLWLRDLFQALPSP